MGKDGMYPSRSELIRVATKEFLVRELQAMKSFSMYEKEGEHPNSKITDRTKTPKRIREDEVLSFMELLDGQELKLVEEPNPNKN